MLFLVILIAFFVDEIEAKKVTRSQQNLSRTLFLGYDNLTYRRYFLLWCNLVYLFRTNQPNQKYA